MIFVTVGTQKQQFTRLIDYIETAKLKTVIMQNGYTKYEGTQIKCLGFISPKDMLKYSKKADYVITHAGITIIELLEQNKKVLVVPREKRYKEHINNHQFEICEALEKEGYILVAHSEEEFLKKVKEIETFIPKKYAKQDTMFYVKLDSLINNLLK